MAQPSAARNRKLQVKRRKKPLQERNYGRMLSLPVIIGIVLFAVVVWQLIDATTHHIIRIESVKVPKSYEDAGFSPEVVRDRIVDAIQKIYADLPHVDGQDRLKDPTAFRDEESQVHEIDFEVSGAKIDFRRFAEGILQLFGRAPAVIKGEITLNLSGGNPALHAQRTQALIRIQQNNIDPLVTPITPSNDNPNTVIEAFAEEILKQLDPYPLAAHDYYVSTLSTNQGIVRQGIDRAVEARQILTDIIDNPKSKAPLLARAHDLLGFTYLDFAKMEDPAKATEEFKAALAQDPDFHLPEHGMARALAAEGELEEANGNKLAAKQKFTEALTYYERMIPHNPKRLLPYYSYASLELRLGDPQAAIQKCEAATKYAADDLEEGAGLYSVLGYAQLAAGNLKDAESAYQTSIEYYRQGSKNTTTKERSGRPVTPVWEMFIF